MNKKVRKFSFRKIGISFLLVLFNWITIVAQENSVQHQILILNNQSFNRIEEVVAIPRESFGRVPEDLFPVVYKDSRTYPCQLVYNDQNGKWDHLLVETSMNSNSKDTLQVKWVSQVQIPSDEKLTNVRFSLKTKTSIPEAEITFLERQRGFKQNAADPVYQMEGPGIENDKVAFRAFFDSRNGKDIYGKLQRQPILEEVGVNGSWHSMQSWGMDILRTGNSLGAGALAIQQNGKVFRLADADKTTFKMLYEGPLKASFKLDFLNWDAAGFLKNGSEELSIVKGDYYYVNNIQLDLSKKQQLVSGIANFDSHAMMYKKHNKKFSSVSMYGAQADGTRTKLGLAVLFSTKQFKDKVTTIDADSIPNTSYVTLKSMKEDNYTIYFFSCWEKTNPIFATQNGFDNYLQQVADKLANPIKIKIINKSNK